MIILGSFSKLILVVWGIKRPKLEGKEKEDLREINSNVLIAESILPTKINNRYT